MDVYTPPPTITRKVVLVGDEKVGKTAFTKCAQGEPFEKRYIPTLELDVKPCLYTTTRGLSRRFNIWDCAGSARFDGSRERFYCDARIGLVMYDESLKSRRDWVADLGDVPIVRCVNHKHSRIVEYKTNTPEGFIYHINARTGSGIKTLLNDLSLI